MRESGVCFPLAASFVFAPETPDQASCPSASPNASSWDMSERSFVVSLYTHLMRLLLSVLRGFQILHCMSFGIHSTWAVLQAEWREGPF